jgi:hypothetical protein
MSSPAAVPTVGASSPRFLDQVRQAAMEHFNRADAAQRCMDWARRFILFHNKRHPAEMGGPEIGEFLKQVAQGGGGVVDQLQNALEALTFVYEHVVHRDVGQLALPQPPRVLDRLRQALRVRHYSPRTEDCYVEWATRFSRNGVIQGEMGSFRVVLGGTHARKAAVNYAEAEPLLLQGYEGMKQGETTMIAPWRYRLAEAGERLIRYYEETDQPKKAREWREKVSPK